MVFGFPVSFGRCRFESHGAGRDLFTSFFGGSACFFKGVTRSLESAKPLFYWGFVLVAEEVTHHPSKDVLVLVEVIVFYRENIILTCKDIHGYPGIRRSKRVPARVRETERVSGL